MRASSRPRGQAPTSSYHITPAAALVNVEFPEIAGAALTACYRGGTWFESTAAHQVALCLPDALNVPATRPDH
jgi:hypothetical protein